MKKKINKTRVSIILGALMIAGSIIFYSYQRTLQVKAELKLAEERKKQEESRKEQEKISISAVSDTETVKGNENKSGDETVTVVDNTENIGSADSSDIKEMRENIISSGNKNKNMEYEKELISKMNEIEKKYQDVFDNGSMVEVEEAVGKLYDEWDNELNKIYKILMANLPENAKTTLRNSQREWIKNRDKESELAGKEVGGGTAEGLIYIDKATELTEERTIQLAKLYDKLSSR